MKEFVVRHTCGKNFETAYVRVGFGHHMRVGFCLWAIQLTRVARKVPHFGIGIIRGAIPMSFPVF